MGEYHVPVLLQPSLDGLAIVPNGFYVDATFGGGGHAKAIAAQLDDNGHLFVFDQDIDAQANLWDDPRVTLIISNFRHIARWMQYYHVHGAIDGVLADLGVSSHQFDDPTRGFSYRFDESLDMRMNVSQSLTAADLLNSRSAAELQSIFSRYGEVTNARTLANEIVSRRKASPIRTTGQLAELAETLAKGQKLRYLSQLFQALRIEVNDEMNALKELLTGTQEVLKPGGRMAVITYHSLEDRLVKRYFKSGNFEGERETDFFGNTSSMWELINNKPIEPDEEEQRRNPRSRSAKLRVANKK
jgi:16S rRNA (cytosine1402-N4)-methyltransferase